MIGFGKLAGAAALSLAVSGADAQQTGETPLNVDDITSVQPVSYEGASPNEMVIPHPDGPIIMDVALIAAETREELKEQLRRCLQKGFEFSDENGNGELDEDEAFHYISEQEWCAEEAMLDTRGAVADARIAISDARIAAAEASIAETEAKIRAITDGLMEGARAEGG